MVPRGMQEPQADTSLADLKRALVQASRPHTHDLVGAAGTLTTPSTLTSSPTRFKPPAPATTDNLLRRSQAAAPASQALRSELRALQDGLLQLKQVIASRRTRFVSTAAGGGTAVAAGSPQTTLPGGPSDHQPPPNNKDHSFAFDEDAVSQTDSAAPSAAIQAHILTTLQSVSQRLQQLEGRQQGPASSTNMTPSRSPQTATLAETSYSATLDGPQTASVVDALQTELTVERFQRLKLEALVKVLGMRLGLDVTGWTSGPLVSRVAQEASQASFDPATIMNMSPAELRAMVQVLSVRTKEALRTQTAAKCKAVQLDGALRTISDLSARIVYLEDRLASEKAGSAMPPVNLVADTISDLSLKLRSQSMCLRSLRSEATLTRKHLASAAFEVCGVSDGDIERALRSLEAIATQSPTSNKLRRPPAGSSPSRLQSAQSPSDNHTPPQEHNSSSPFVAPGQVLHAGTEYSPVPGDPIDQAVATFFNQRTSKVFCVRVRPGAYTFGHLKIRIGLSQTSKTPLVFHDGKKYSLKKFVSLFEEAEHIYQMQTSSNFAATTLNNRQLPPRLNNHIPLPPKPRSPVSTAAALLDNRGRSPPQLLKASSPSPAARSAYSEAPRRLLERRVLSHSPSPPEMPPYPTRADTPNFAPKLLPFPPRQLEPQTLSVTSSTGVPSTGLPSTGLSSNRPSYPTIPTYKPATLFLRR